MNGVILMDSIKTSLALLGYFFVKIIDTFLQNKLSNDNKRGII